MRKFKLIKEYPGSPKLGIIVQTRECYSNIYKYDIRKDPATGGIAYKWLYSKIVENYPEFWEEVKEPVFISDDGVEMYEGDSYWANLADLSDVVMLEITDTTPKDNVLSFKRFSTKEAALKYIDLHKLKYSKSDIIETLRIAKYYSDFKHLLGEL